jgi:hypothetical protein
LSSRLLAVLVRTLDLETVFTPPPNVRVRTRLGYGLGVDQLSPGVRPSNVDDLRRAAATARRISVAAEP